MGETRIGLYLHVPFCLRKCPYCDFYSVTYTEAAADAYTEALLRAMADYARPGLRAKTLYFGGGTPVLLGPGRLGRLIAAAGERFHLSPEAEITVEANPAAAMEPALRDLRAAGANRLSMGVQSLQDSELRALGRAHDADTAVRAVEAAARAGFAHISADLMLAIPGQTEASLADTIERLTALPVEHLSAYLLKLEEGTPFFSRYGGGEGESAGDLPGEDETADRYLRCVEWLAAAGFEQYEISNFARNGRVARHNLLYWRCEPYLGLGPAAHSFLEGRRFYVPRDLDAFLAARHPKELAVDDGPGGDFQERAMLALRLTEGFAPGSNAGGASGSGAGAASMLQKARALAAHGLVTVEGERIALTPRGFLLSNSVTAALLAAEEVPKCGCRSS